MIRVTFVHHDCFVVELNETILVFDYIPKDALMDSEPPVYLHGKMPILPEAKKLFFFVSTGNKDAFSEEIVLLFELRILKVVFFFEYSEYEPNIPLIQRSNGSEISQSGNRFTSSSSVTMLPQLTL